MSLIKQTQLQIYHRSRAYAALMRLDKPVGTALLLWPAMWGLLLAANGLPSYSNVLIFAVGTLLMRSAGCAINDFADRHIDGKVIRTATRPLPQQQIQPFEALVVAAVLAGLAFCLVIFTNQLTVFMSFAGLGFAGLYPFTKRWIASPQLVLGLAFAWAIPMGFAATLKYVPLEAWYYFAATLFWIVGYDTYYAMADREEDRFLNIGSTALLFGKYAARFSFLFTLVFICSFYWLLTPAALEAKNWLQQIGVLIVGLALSLSLSVYQYLLARTEQPAQCTKAFKMSNYVGLVITVVLILTA